VLSLAFNHNQVRVFFVSYYLFNGWRFPFPPPIAMHRNSHLKCSGQPVCLRRFLCVSRVSLINQSDQATDQCVPGNRLVGNGSHIPYCMGSTAIDGTRFAAFPAHDAKQLICQMSALYHPYLGPLSPAQSHRPGASVKTHYALRHFRALRT